VNLFVCIINQKGDTIILWKGSWPLWHEHHNLAYEPRDLGPREKPESHIPCSCECRGVHNYVLLFLLHGPIVNVLVQMIWINVDMRHDNFKHVNLNAQTFLIKLKHCSKKLWLYICLDDMNFDSRWKKIIKKGSNKYCISRYDETFKFQPC
jgi:hypothetical protein